MDDHDSRGSLISRRQLLRRAVLVTAGAAAVGAIAEGCSKPLKCDDTTGLAEVDVATRKALEYADASTDPSKYCKTCAQYAEPAQAGSCGGCKMFKGPVNPQGTCKAWAKK